MDKKNQKLLANVKLHIDPLTVWNVVCGGPVRSSFRPVGNRFGEVLTARPGTHHLHTSLHTSPGRLFAPARATKAGDVPQTLLTCHLLVLYLPTLTLSTLLCAPGRPDRRGDSR